MINFDIRSFQTPWWVFAMQAVTAVLVPLIAALGPIRGGTRITVREAGSACTVRSVEAGWDGTLVVQSAADACTFRWWPGLLGG